MNDEAPGTRTPEIVPRLATIGRIGLVLAGLISLLAAIIDGSDFNTVSMLLRIVGSLGLMAVAVMAVVKPMRAFDLGAVVLAALLAGSAATYGFADYGFYDISVTSILAWLLLLAFGGLTASALAFGPPVDDEAFGDQVKGLFSSSPSSSNAPSYPPPAQPQSPPSGYAPPASPQSYPPPTAQPPAQQPPVQQPPTHQYPPPAAPSPAPEPVVEEPAVEETAAEGWYPQADGKTARYWDGSEWTDNIRPLSDAGQ